MKYFIANWKANKNLNEAESWLSILENQIQTNNNLQDKLNNDRLKIIIAPPHPFISDLQHTLNNLRSKYPYFKNIHLAAQDISQFDEGNYTGEDTAKSLIGLIDYTIIGHSERRKFSSETDQILLAKFSMAEKYGIQAIFVIRDEKDTIPESAKIIAYEPEISIGTGNNQPPDEVIKLKNKLNLPDRTVFLYGGSVNSSNSSVYLNTVGIDGFLIGKASLDPVEFTAIANS